MVLCTAISLALRIKSSTDWELKKYMLNESINEK